MRNGSIERQSLEKEGVLEVLVGANIMMIICGALIKIKVALDASRNLLSSGVGVNMLICGGGSL